MRTRLPWITTLVWAILALSPFGQDVFRSAFLSGEALSRGIWQPLYLSALAVAALTIALEALLRQLVWKRRKAGRPPPR
jgi:hypothetical protein